MLEHPLRIAGLVVVLALCTPAVGADSQTDLDARTQQALRSLSAGSDLIVTGTIARAYDYRSSGGGVGYDVVVSDVMKGRVTRRTLYFRSTGRSGYARYRRGEKVLLFLQVWGYVSPRLYQVKPVTYLASPSASLPNGSVRLWPVAEALRFVRQQVTKPKIPPEVRERVERLKKNVDQFSIEVRYAGSEPRKHPSLTLTVPPPGPTANPAWDRHVRISTGRAERIIDHLARAGLLDVGSSGSGSGRSPASRPTYTLTVDGGLMLWRDLGWDLKMYRRLEALRQVLDGEARAAMDRLLKALAPLRDKWLKDVLSGKVVNSPFRGKYDPSSPNRRGHLVARAREHLARGGLGSKYDLRRGVYVETPARLGQDYVAFPLRGAGLQANGYVRVHCLVRVTAATGKIGAVRQLSDSGARAWYVRPGRGGKASSLRVTTSKAKSPDPAKPEGKAAD